MATLVFKAAMVAILGNRRLLGRVAIGFGAAIAMGSGWMKLGPK